MTKVLILFAHPRLQHSKTHVRLIHGLDKISGVTFHDLYEAYPDFDIDVAYEQEMLLHHDIVIMQYPFFGIVLLPLSNSGLILCWNMAGHTDCTVKHSPGRN